MRNNQTFSLFVGTVLILTLSAGVPAEDGGKDTGETGTVSGQVVFPGSAVEGGVVPADAVIYLVGDGLASGAAPLRGSAVKPVLNQQDITFVPHVLVVAAGGEVEIRNSDAILHNVHTRSRANRPFNRSQLAGMQLSKVFSEPEVVTVSCDVHSQMSAFIVVTPNGFFTQAGEDGTYTIPDVPAGEYQLVAWHEKYGTVSTDIEVTPGQTTQAELQFAATQ